MAGAMDGRDRVFQHERSPHYQPDRLCAPPLRGCRECLRPSLRGVADHHNSVGEVFLERDLLRVSLKLMCI